MNDKMTIGGPRKWAPAQRSKGYGAYDSWNRIAADRRSPDREPSAGNARFLRVFARLTPENTGIAGQTAHRLRDIITILKQHDGVRFDTTEARNLERLWQRAKTSGDSQGWDRRVVLMMKRPILDKLARQGLFDVLHVGTPLAIPKKRPNKKKKQRLDGDEQTTAASGSPPPRVLVGIVDDAIPFLHRRYQTVAGTSRFRRVWLQGTQVVDFDAEELADGIDRIDDAVFEDDQPKGHRYDPHVGRILSREAINRKIKQVLAAEKAVPQGTASLLRTESQVYKGLANKVSTPGERRRSPLTWSHGAQVTDLACGAEPGEMDDIKILGVQLPPHAVRDTSGRELSAYAIQATRWIIDQAIAINKASGHKVPLVINLSLGVLAGPKDGSGFVEDWLEQEIKRFIEVSDNAPIRIVLAYGNAYRNRQIAVQEIEPNETAELEWRLQPDDRTDSFIEIRAKRAEGLEWSLQPAGRKPKFAALPRAGQHRELDLGRGTVAAVLRDGQEQSASTSLLIAMRPTASLEGGPLAPQGAWCLALKNSGKKKLVVTLQIQRDDTPRGYRESGRQSFFDHEAVGSLDAELKDYVGLGDSPITTEGTHSSYAGLASENPCVYSVGAARSSVSWALLDQHRGVEHPPAYYSSAGTTRKTLSKSVGPDLSAFADEGNFLTGIQAKGLLTGSSARLSGTSAAAPQVTRSLALLDKLEAFSGSGSGSAAARSAELKALLGQQPPTREEWKARLGAGILVP